MRLAGCRLCKPLPEATASGNARRARWKMSSDLQRLRVSIGERAHMLGREARRYDGSGLGEVELEAVCLLLVADLKDDVEIRTTAVLLRLLHPTCRGTRL